jgi:DNA polymerase III subunit delta'
MSDTADLLPPWLAAQRAQLLSSQAHALLLHGPSGLGHYELALSLASSWLCEANDIAQRMAAGQGACGQCASCQQIAARSHTDLRILMPEALMLELGWPLSEKAQKDIDDKKRKPSKEIRVEEVREVLAFAELTSGRGAAKVVLVYPAEQLNTPSANALLKTLEEPLGSLRFVLATEAAHELLPTIRSRCQAYALPQPPASQALAWMASQIPATSPVPEERLKTALQASGGRPLNALSMLSDGQEAGWAGLPLAMQKGQVEAVKTLNGMQLLDALQKLCHDLWAIKLGSLPRFFAAQDLPRPPPARALAAWGQALSSLRRSIEHPYKADLLLEDMVNQAKVCINSRV